MARTDGDVGCASQHSWRPPVPGGTSGPLMHLLRRASSHPLPIATSAHSHPLLPYPRCCGLHARLHVRPLRARPACVPGAQHCELPPLPACGAACVGAPHSAGPAMLRSELPGAHQCTASWSTARGCSVGSTARGCSVGSTAMGSASMQAQGPPLGAGGGVLRSCVTGHGLAGDACHCQLMHHPWVSSLARTCLSRGPVGPGQHVAGSPFARRPAIAMPPPPPRPAGFCCWAGFHPTCTVAHVRQAPAPDS